MEKITTDVLIIGGGLAAMTAALEASESPCSILAVSKSKVGNSGATLMAGSNFAAVLPEAEAEGDSVALHIEDTYKEGGRINDIGLVHTLAENAAGDLLQLEGVGVKFLKRGGRFDIRKPPGHEESHTCCHGSWRDQSTFRRVIFSIPIPPEALPASEVRGCTQLLNLKSCVRP